MTFSISARLSSRDSGDGSRDDMEKVMYYIFFIIYMYFRRILCMSHNFIGDRHRLHI